MAKTATGLVGYVTGKLGTPYVYAAKMETVTQAKINTWSSLYPSMFTSSYQAKARNFIGKVATDCSGLISGYTGVVRGSASFKSTATKVVAIGKLDETMIGWGLWRSGHIGVYIGNGYCIEARGIDYGTVKTKVSSRNFTHVIQLKDIDYTKKGDSAATDTVSDGTILYTIQPGDTLIAIGKSYDVLPGNIVLQNLTKYPKMTMDYIVSGWTIQIPSNTSNTNGYDGGENSSVGSDTSSSGLKFSTGDYMLLSNMNVRTGPGTDYSVKSKDMLTLDGQKKSDDAGALKKGIKVTVREVIQVSSGYYWALIPSGYVCMANGDKVYMEKV